MTVRDFIKVLEQFPANSELSFNVGRCLKERDNLAKAQVRTAETLHFMDVTSIISKQEFYDGELDVYTNSVTIAITPRLQDFSYVQELAADFDTIVGDLKLRR